MSAEEYPSRAWGGFSMLTLAGALCYPLVEGMFAPCLVTMQTNSLCLIHTSFLSSQPKCIHQSDRDVQRRAPGGGGGGGSSSRRCISTHRSFPGICPNGASLERERVPLCYVAYLNEQMTNKGTVRGGKAERPPSPKLPRFHFTASHARACTRHRSGR